MEEHSKEGGVGMSGLLTTVCLGANTGPGTAQKISRCGPRS